MATQNTQADDASVLTLPALLNSIQLSEDIPDATTAASSYKTYSGTAMFDASWAQGRSIYGGIAAAVLVQAMRVHVDLERKLRSLMVSFVGPIAPGKVELEVRVLREGRSASQLEAKIMQNGEVATAVQAAFGSDRKSSVSIDSPKRPPVKPPEEGISFPQIPGVTPAFTQHLDYKITEGLLPFMGAENGNHAGWFKYKDIAGVNAEVLTVALADAYPPAVLQMLAKPAPASSLSWAMDFTEYAADSNTEGWWYLKADTKGGENGYAQQTSYVWNPAGEMVVFDYQTIAVFG